MNLPSPWVFRAACLLLLLAGGCGSEMEMAASARRGIVNGTLETGFVPVGALVSAVVDGTPSGSFCTGSLIHPNWVLTAAHCVAGGNGRVPDGEPVEGRRYLHFFMGTDTSSPAAGRAVLARAVHVHPGYGAPGGQRLYDLALFELAEPVNDVEPLVLHRLPLEGRVGSELLYVGFGVTDSDGGGGGIKRSAVRHLSSVEPVIYVTAQSGGGVCFGDSGGPGLIDQDGRLEVVGINSTVIGDPACNEYSTQIRVDAYQTWIDRTMGGEGDCREDVAACACNQACGADGVCDNAQCGAEGCENILTCLRFCRTAVCQAGCYLGATPEASYLYTELAECAGEHCPGGEVACLERFCRRERFGCAMGLEAVTGEADCGRVHRCSAPCGDDQPCRDDCYYEATLLAQASFAALDSCRATACAEVTTATAADACAARACRGELLSCLPDEGCRLTGGSCAEGYACTAELWAASYCVESEGFAVGAPCEVGKVGCADGAICADLGEGPLCYEACTNTSECERSYGPCARMTAPGLHFSLGVCNLRCPDADGDGTCDADEPRCEDGTLPPCPAPPPPPLQPEASGCRCVARFSNSSSSFWLWAALPLGLLRRRRAKLMLAAVCALFVGCAGQDPVATPDAGVRDSGLVLPPPRATIWDVQQGLVEPGQVITLANVIVSSPTSTSGFFLSDGTNDAFSGLWVQLDDVDSASLGLRMGETITLEGRVAEHAFDEEANGSPIRTRTELIVGAGFELRRGTVSSPPSPAPVPVYDLALPDLAELYEGVVISVSDVTVSEQLASRGTIRIEDIIEVGDLFVDFELTWLEPGARFTELIGALHFDAGRYVIEPRTLDDLVRAAPGIEGCLPVSGYLICPDRLTWNGARRNCAARGGRLVILQTEEENLAVGELYADWREGTFWIGLSDRADEGVFVWIDGSPLEYSGWDDGEPNDYGSGEDCTESNWDGPGVWNDAGCGSRRAYVCELLGEGARCAMDADCVVGPGTCQDGSCVPL